MQKILNRLIRKGSIPSVPTVNSINPGMDVIAGIKRANGVPGMKEGGKTGGKWIQDAIKKPGALKKTLGVKAGEKIPVKTLAKAAKAPGVTGKRARLAQTLKKLHK